MAMERTGQMSRHHISNKALDIKEPLPHSHCHSCTGVLPKDTVVVCTSGNRTLELPIMRRPCTFVCRQCVVKCFCGQQQLERYPSHGLTLLCESGKLLNVVFQLEPPEGDVTPPTTFCTLTGAEERTEKVQMLLGVTEAEG